MPSSPLNLIKNKRFRRPVFTIAFTDTGKPRDQGKVFLRFSQAIEDKAVDILLMKKCFTSTHTQFEKEFFFAFQEGYKITMKQAINVFKRSAKAEARARHLKEEHVIGDYLIS